ncbi:NUDIX hydrolase [Aeromonas allosaccharophila]|uniref:NUDIX hydrolase n=1 Tax=Aeromonas allosaccharophila TaxID=656 RepID=UPI002B473629|nr:NUDIX pyrophosphatase [Aeromonas allosaccharophila]
MRAPFQVLIIPYKHEGVETRFLLGRRNDNDVWQAISGGGEERESLLESAKRELLEETSLVGTNWQQLDSMCMLPKVYYTGHEHWINHRYVIPEYSFSVQVTGDPKLSPEHSEFRWCGALEASNLLDYDSNKIALWELCERLEIHLG